MLSRCPIYNRTLLELSPAAIPPDLLKTLETGFEVYYKYRHCHKIFWKRSHYKSMVNAILQYIGQYYFIV